MRGLVKSLARLGAVLSIAAFATASAASPTKSGIDPLLAWGYNFYGQLGDTTTTDAHVPVPVQLPTGTKATGVAVGAAHSLAVTSAGSVLAWGNNDHGQLGIGTATGPDTCSTNPCSTTPVTVMLPSGTKAKRVVAGWDHSFALTTNGSLLAWGNNEEGELGDGTNTGPDTCGSTACSTSPVKVKLPKHTQVIAAAGGFVHSLALTSTGSVLAWGFNGYGELGNGKTAESDLPLKVKLPKGTKATAVAASDQFSLALTSSGSVLAWGYGGLGQLGNGHTRISYLPTKVKLPKGTKAVAIAAGSNQGFALTSKGTLLAWGVNSLGELGDGTMSGPQKCSHIACSRTPVKVKLPKHTEVTAITASFVNGFALTSKGTVLAWGANFLGQLGNASGPSPSDVPVAVTLPSGDKVTSLALGSQAEHMLAIAHHG